MISENEIHVLQCIVIHSNEDLDITINLKPYFYSKMEIEAKKEFHYFIYCVDVDDNFIFPDTLDELQKFVEGEGSKVDGKPREGIVFYDKATGQTYTKFVSPEFLIKFH